MKLRNGGTDCVRSHGVEAHARQAMTSGLEPNAENKLFVGGCPPNSGEEDLRELFEKHGQVEEVFVMRGNSRSGMACAFIRFASQPMAQAAIDAIHGQHKLREAAEPLVVRWADTPGSRKRDGREGGRKRGGGGGGSGGGGGGKFNNNNNNNLANAGGWAPGMPMQMGWDGFSPEYMYQMAMQQQMQQQVAAMGGSYASGPFYGVPNGAMGMASFMGAQQMGAQQMGAQPMMGYPPQGMMQVPYMQQPMMQQCYATAGSPIITPMMGAQAPPMQLSPAQMEGQQAGYPYGASSAPIQAAQPM
jgi:hypothetical protein